MAADKLCRWTMNTHKNHETEQHIQQTNRLTKASWKSTQQRLNCEPMSEVCCRFSSLCSMSSFQKAYNRLIMITTAVSVFVHIGVGWLYITRPKQQRAAWHVWACWDVCLSRWDWTSSADCLQGIISWSTTTVFIKSSWAALNTSHVLMATGLVSRIEQTLSPNRIDAPKAIAKTF